VIVHIKRSHGGSVNNPISARRGGQYPVAARKHQPRTNTSKYGSSRREEAHSKIRNEKSEPRYLVSYEKVFMSDILNKTIVLVLNRNWQAINIRTPQEAFCQMATNVATALEIDGGKPSSMCLSSENCSNTWHLEKPSTK
jgi:hypothetical protein